MILVCDLLFDLYVYVKVKVVGHRAMLISDAAIYTGLNIIHALQSILFLKKY